MHYISLYLYSPGVEDDMEGCPSDHDLNMLYLGLSGLMWVVLFIAGKAIAHLRDKLRKRQSATSIKDLKESDEFTALQKELYRH